MKGICLRCGNKYDRLDRHLSKKNNCNVNYLDVDKETMIDKYNELLVKYKELKNGHKCSQCDKIYKHKSGLYRHMKIHKIQNNIFTNCGTVNYGSIVNGDVIHNTTNITNQTINIILNNFGEEEDIDVDVVKEILEKDVLDDSDYIGEYFAKLFIEKEENRNVYLSGQKTNIMHIYKNNKWTHQDKKIITDLIINKVIDRLEFHRDRYYQEALDVEKNNNVEATMTEEYKKYNNIKNIVKLLNNNLYNEIEKTERNIECKLLDNKEVLVKNYNLMK